jgi:hypothetical protein
MEVWDLDECDFLETKFVEYPDSNSFFDEQYPCTKGVISYFHRQDGSPFYVYKPLNIMDAEEINTWEEEIVDKYQNNTNQNINSENDEKMVWIKNIYWKLEKLSCVLVLRNKKWFQDNVGQIQKIWNIIEEERVTGYEHRAPVRKNRKEKETNPNGNPFINNIGCLLLSKNVKN